MAVPPYVTAGTTIDETWGDQIADAVVNPFASSAARSAAITAPTNGMTSTITAASALNGFEVYNGVNWAKPWSSPWGIVTATAGGTSGFGYVVVTAAQGSITTQVALTNLTVTFSMVTGRMYRVNAHCNFFSSVASDTATLTLVRDGTSVALAHTAALGTSNNNLRTAGITRPVVGNTTGSVTIRLDAERQSGTGNITMHAGAVNVATMVIEDIGPYGAPA